jgi:GPH family glycoside/pentoside/hexuronide:cation symporter
VLSGKLGKTGALMLGLCLYVVVLYALYAALPSVNVTAIAGLMMLAGMTNGAYQQIPWAIYPDLMDVTRAQSGVAIEGAFSAIWLFGQKLANALAPAILGLILAQAGWVEATGAVVAQSDQALGTLRVAVTVLPAGILVVAILGLGVAFRPALRRAA